MTSSTIRRVLMTGDTVGGVWTFVLELAEALGQKGIEVILATLGGLPTPAQWLEVQRVPNLRLIPSTYKLEWMQDAWADVEAAGKWLTHLDAMYAPDLIHFNSYGPGILRSRRPVVLTVHSCVVSWWKAVRGTSLPPEWNRYRDIVERSLNSADFVVAPTKAMMDTLPHNYSMQVRRTRVIANGRRPECFLSGVKQPFILTAGRVWDEAKNVAALAKIAHRLPWPVYLAGDNRHPDGSPVPLGSCNVLGRLSHDQLAGWYSRASIYALPARYEPFGLSILEAALSGCALVLGDIPTLREIWEAAAVFVAPNEPEALEVAIRKLLAEPLYRQEMAHRAHQRAQSYTSERMATHYFQVYSELMEPKTVGRGQSRPPEMGVAKSSML